MQTLQSMYRVPGPLGGSTRYSFMTSTTLRCKRRIWYQEVDIGDSCDPGANRPQLFKATDPQTLTKSD